MSVKEYVSRERVLEVLDYNSETGVFTWKQRRPNFPHKGKAAGNVDATGYIRIRIDNRPYSAHRLAWLVVYGYTPNKELDHINGDKADNRICNLREATRTENLRNRGILRNNKSGVTGVRWIEKKGKWYANIKLPDKRMSLGAFLDFESAVAARVAAEKLYFGEFSSIRNRSKHSVQVFAG